MARHLVKALEELKDLIDRCPWPCSPDHSYQSVGKLLFRGIHGECAWDDPHLKPWATAWGSWGRGSLAVGMEGHKDSGSIESEPWPGRVEDPPPPDGELDLPPKQRGFAKMMSPTRGLRTANVDSCCFRWALGGGPVKSNDLVLLQLRETCLAWRQRT
jgi:hypothetical protein